MNYNIHYLDTRGHARAFPAVRSLLRSFCQLLRKRGCTRIIPKQERRYIITREYLGYSSPRHAVRFCGCLIGSRSTRADAEALIEEHRASKNPHMMNETTNI